MSHDRAQSPNLTVPVAAATPEAAALEFAYRHCTALTREHSRSFFFSSQFMPRAKRHHIRALYAFCRTSDDIVDRPVGEAASALADWVAQVWAPAPADQPVLLAWEATARRFAIPRLLIDELLTGLAMDLTIDRYATFDELWVYCYRVASVVGLMVMHIIGYDEGAESYAIKLGVALQLTNILRDVGEDAARGRIYLPQEDLARFGLTDDDIVCGRRDERWRALMEFEIARAHQLYDEAWPGIGMLSRDGRFAIGAAAQVYRGILGQIVANDYDVFQRRAHLSLLQKLRVLPDVRRRVRALDRL